ncbi:tetrahydrofolate dehydrogenase/cyclohydrolase catalytic domain-containing protein [Amycolatopsis granulosa]|uniref:tetrahydrofolate dehydrogenase/cyclohydrolase catalytic domain-containing protein n=1 Tax=Amycolatopsis granulosa TaxID=185684 RepID=UPI002443BAD8|nr:tetrahydrofolate dehydrogenase/cyclohydrolase catalytic domain-containing protein [Amycolatopsis granulosa]NIH86966.1 5,10-methylene-tetrahydrofolate dehydrogenase/methenyl tetrahydrofolate cyclohydrolase [Amycolatopsis granulosa]
MVARLLDGASVAATLLDETAARVRALSRPPLLATVLVGDDPASHTYGRMKRNRCAHVGISSRSVERPASTTTAELVGRVAELSADPGVDGILLQHPVPRHIDERAGFEAIAPAKDVDGVTIAQLRRHGAR